MTIPLTVACYTSTKNHTLNPVNSFVLVSPSLSLKFHTLRFSVTIINFEQVFVCGHNGNLLVKYLQTKSFINPEFRKTPENWYAPI